MGKKDKEEKMILEKPKADKIIKKKRRSSAAASGTSLYVSPIASPLANERQTKNVLRLTKKATKDKKVRRGVKEVVKAIRKNEKGVCLIAGDIFPVDVISHLPVLCEEAGIPYIYVPTKEALGIASATKRPTSCVLIGANKDSEYKPLYDKCTEFIKETQQ